jgi:integrase
MKQGLWITWLSFRLEFLFFWPRFQLESTHLQLRLQEPKTDAPTSEMTLATFMETHYAPHARMHKRTFLKDQGMYNNRIGPRFGHYPLNKIPRLDVQVFHNEMVQKEKVSAATADHHLKFMRRMLNLAVQWEFIDKSPLSRIALFNQDNQIEHFLDSEAIQRLVAVLKSHPKKVIALLLMFLLSTGARKASAKNAKWEEIDFANRMWRIPATNSKSKKVVIVPLNDSAVWVLEQLHTAGSKGFIFVHERTGKPYTAIEKTWYEVRRLAGLGEKVRIHDLRHTYASLLVTSGRSLYEVQKILAHSDPKITMRYAHLSAKTLQEAANAASVLMPQVATAV